MTTVALKILGHPSPETVQSRLGFFKVQDQSLVFRSFLDAEASLNDHLVWFWGKLKHQRRLLKRVATEGGTLKCFAQVPSGSVHLLPNGAEMLHLLGAELIVEST